MFKVIIKDTNEEVSRAAFSVMKEVLDSKPNPVLGLATGSSPVGLYKEMIKDHQETVMGTKTQMGKGFLSD